MTLPRMLCFAGLLAVTVLGTARADFEQRPVHETGDTASHGNLIFDDILRVEDVRVFPPDPAPGEWVTVTARITPPELGSYLPARGVTLRLREEGQEDWRDFPMLSEKYDETFFYRHIGPVDNDFEFVIRVEDLMGQVIQEAPAYTGKYPIKEGPEVVTAEDPNDSELEAPKDLDMRNLSVAVDDKFLYVRTDVDGKVSKGSLNPTNFQIYACFLLNRDINHGLADVLDIPAFIYAPLLGSMIPFKNGLYSLGAITSVEALGSSRLDHPDLEYKKSLNKLALRVPLELLGENTSGLYQVGCFTTAINDLQRPNPLPRDMSPYVSVYRRSHKVALDRDAQPQPLQVGVAQIDVTPPIGTALGGYTHRKGKPSTGVGMPVKAFALDVQAGSREHVFASVDIVLFTHDMSEKVARIVEGQTGLSRYQLSIAATHTHNGSGAFHPFSAIITGRFDPKVQQELVEKVAQVIIDAHNNKQPATFGAATVQTDMTNNRTTDDGPEDHELQVFRFDDKNGEPLMIFFNYATHPTTGLPELMEFHPDFPGVARTHIEKEWPGALGMFINGAQGDQSPRGKDDKYVGDVMGEEVVALAKTIKGTDRARLSSVWTKVIFSEQRNYESLFQAVRLNDVAFTTIPGELFSEVGQKVKKAGHDMGFKQVALLGLTGDTIGYMVPKQKYHERPYESVFCLFGDGEAAFVDEVSTLMMSRLSKP